jgi:hypothetical protein
MFGRTSKNLGIFLRVYARTLQSSHENNTRDRSIHALASDGHNELQQCIILGAFYVQRIVHALNDHFLDLPIFDTTKFLNPRNYQKTTVIESQILNCGSKGYC